MPQGRNPALDPLLEEEERGPAARVSDEVGREAAVERGERTVGPGEGLEERDCCERGRRRGATSMY